MFIMSLDWLLYCTHHTLYKQSTPLKLNSGYGPADIARTVHNLFLSRLDCDGGALSQTVILVRCLMGSKYTRDAIAFIDDLENEQQQHNKTKIKNKY